jgi:nitroreductase
MAPNDDLVPSTPVIETILARRSVRFGYEQRPVSHEHLESVLSCGLAAPSSKNAKPWRFHVVEDERLRHAIADAAVRGEGVDQYVPHDPRTGRPSPHWSSTVLESADVVREAPAIVLIENRGVFSAGRVALVQASREALASSLTGYGFEVMGLGAALENVWLAANSLGIGVAFLGDLNIAEDEIRAMLGLEGDLMGVIALGYAPLEAPPRREPPAETQVAAPVVWH